MLSLLEILGQGVLWLFRILQGIEFLIYIVLGMRWLFSPSYREEVRNQSGPDNWFVPLSAFFLCFIILVSALSLIVALLR